MKELIEHGEKGHVNCYVKDQDDYITNYGKHARVIVFDGDYCRIDIKAGDIRPTDKDIIKVIQKYNSKYNNMSKNVKIEILRKEEFPSHSHYILSSIDVDFKFK